MQTPHPKRMARILREALAEHDLRISHSTALELVAKQLGHADWNVLAAQIGPDSSNIQQDAESAASHGKVPEGWFVSGRSDLFRHDLLPDAGPDRKPALLIESRAPQERVSVAKAGEFLTVMQRISAVPYRGKSVSFRAQISCVSATGNGRIWIHARGQSRDALAFENLGLNRGPAGPIAGTTEWTHRTVTIEVPDEAVYVGFGILFGSGTGVFRAANLSFGLAEGDERPSPLPDTPRNLDLVLAD